jgi:histidinol-phosphate aminotransferase
LKPEIEKPDHIIKLTQNENAFGASPLALKSIEENYHSVFRYPDVFHIELKQKLADKFSVKPENIVISAGSVALMDMSIKAFVGDGENVVTAELTFEGYKYMSRVNHRECRQSKLTNNSIDLKKILELCDEKTRLIFIANPNNPTGTINTHAEMVELMENIPPETYVVSDEAYVEYVTDSNFPDTQSLQKTYPNLIIFKTFSKIYGLAGLRVGYAIAHEDVISTLRDHWTPFSINGLGYPAAIASLDDEQYIKKCTAVNAEERTYLYKELIALGFNAVEPKGNFIFIQFDTKSEAEQVNKQLEEDGILIRPLDRFGSDTALRITVGMPDENRYVVECLKKRKSQ